MSWLLKFKRFRTQVLLLFLLVVMIPMVVLSVYLYDGIVQSTQSYIERQLENESSQWLAGYQERCAQVHTLAYMIRNNPTFRNYMIATPQNDVELIKMIRHSFRPMLEWLVTTNDIVYRIHFFTDNSELPEDKYVSQFSRHAGEAWFEEMRTQAQNGRMMPVAQAWRLPYEGEGDHYPLSSAYQVQMTPNPASYLQLDIAAEWLYDGIPLAVDQHTGRVIYSTLDPGLVGTRFDPPLQENKGFLRQAVEVSGESYYMSACSAENDAALFIHLVPASDVMGQIQEAQRNYLISCIALAMLMITMAWIIARHVTRRVGKIGRMVGQIAQGEYEVSYVPQYYDEIDTLGRDVREMGKAMDRLVNQELRQSLLIKDAEFRALQAQMNPHFIFNTLESFQMLAELEGLRDLSDIMALFGKLVRYNLEHAPIVPLRREIENVTDYVAVQNLNWNGRIRLSVTCEESLMDWSVLRLMLQPVVENAITHGMPVSGELHVDVRIVREAKGLRLRVANDGKGVTPEEEQRLHALLEEARESPVCAQTKSIALQNIQRRLMIHYGPGCLIHFGQGGGCGFFVEFMLPDERGGQ